MVRYGLPPTVVERAPAWTGGPKRTRVLGEIHLDPTWARLVTDTDGDAFRTTCPRSWAESEEVTFERGSPRTLDLVAAAHGRMAQSIRRDRAPSAIFAATIRFRAPLCVLTTYLGKPRTPRRAATCLIPAGYVSTTRQSGSGLWRTDLKPVDRMSQGLRFGAPALLGTCARPSATRMMQSHNNLIR